MNNGTFTIYDFQGRNIFSMELGEHHEYELNVVGFAQGVYLLILRDTEGTILGQSKFVKK